MLAIFGGLVVFVLLAVLVLQLVSSEERAAALNGPAAIAIWFVYLIHADTVVNAAYTDVGRLAVPKSTAFAAGAVVGGAGIVLFLWATRTLASRGGFKGLRATRLVTSGPYRLMRQPQNTGWALLLLGVAIAGRTMIGVGLVVAFAVFVALLARAEDRALRAAFGAAYDAWRASTPLVALRVAKRQAA